MASDDEPDQETLHFTGTYVCYSLLLLYTVNNNELKFGKEPATGGQTDRQTEGQAEVLHGDLVTSTAKA